MQSVALPPEDSAIAQALADLDAKLSAWTTAMRSAQDTLARMADQSESPPSSAPDATAVVVDAPPPQVEPEPARTPHEQKSKNDVGASPAGGPQESSASQPEGAAVRKEKEQTVREIAAAEPEPASADDCATGATSGATAREAPAAEKPEEPARSQASEDEALLATLDEETAKAIRIMRRVDFGRRSVAELLKEYQASRSQAQQSSGKGKSWWSRGKG